MIKIRPQVLTAIVGLMLIAILVIFFQPEYIGEVVASCVTGIGMLAMKVIEDKE